MVVLLLFFGPVSNVITLRWMYNWRTWNRIDESSEQMSAPADMAAFVRSVELGGFSAAARELQLTPSAVSKLVTRLEDRLGVRLLNRTTRKLALTPEGQSFLHRSQRILAD